MEQTKQQLRVRMRRLRSAIPDRSSRSAAICDQVVGRCVAVGARTVMAFVGVASEPDTAGMIARLHALDVRVFLPRVEGTEIVAVEYQRGEPLVPGAFGIAAPEGRALDPLAVDVAIVPGLAFTVDGRRLGQGGGFYDRFLPLLRDECLTIGVCFAEQIVADLPIEPHDRRVDLVVTDQTAQTSAGTSS